MPSRVSKESLVRKKSRSLLMGSGHHTPACAFLEASPSVPPFHFPAAINQCVKICLYIRDDNQKTRTLATVCVSSCMCSFIWLFSLRSMSASAVASSFTAAPPRTMLNPPRTAEQSIQENIICRRYYKVSKVLFNNCWIDSGGRHYGLPIHGCGYWWQRTVTVWYDSDDTMIRKSVWCSVRSVRVRSSSFFNLILKQSYSLTVPAMPLFGEPPQVIIRYSKTQVYVWIYL